MPVIDNFWSVTGNLFFSGLLRLRDCRSVARFFEVKIVVQYLLVIKGKGRQVVLVVNNGLCCIVSAFGLAGCGTYKHGRAVMLASIPGRVGIGIKLVGESDL